MALHGTQASSRVHGARGDFAGEHALRAVVETLAASKQSARDGRDYHIGLDVQPLRDPGGNLTGFIGVQTDVHEREMALEVLEVLTRAIHEAHPEVLPSVLLVEHGAAAGLEPGTPKRSRPAPASPEQPWR